MGMVTDHARRTLPIADTVMRMTCVSAASASALPWP